MHVEHRPLVATLGFFDGVHIGHRYLINQVKAKAKQLNLPAAVVTFPEHPRKVLQQDYQPKLLCGYEEKLEQLETTGIDYCVSMPFTVELATLTAKEFMEKTLKEKINVHTLVVGHDHRFGHNREEGFPEYVKYGNELGIDVMQATELRFEDRHVSSSRIRRLLAEGKIKLANKLLSYNYKFSGKIIEGYKVGRTIGFPTANIQAWEKYKVIPALGVYAVFVRFENEIYKGMLYIGTRPTLHNNNEISMEVNIFDFEGDLYNRSLTVEFVDFIRPDKKFDSVKSLVEQIRQDKITVMERLNN
ncbi:MAG: bifunctional riboflavin kinase/FAD synthetase [Dysgonamonadaceae bacterium]|nr:bifunctional riboflavin kinase/FAD synthetase [Dysgonamonadaceae bacterium]